MSLNLVTDSVGKSLGLYLFIFFCRALIFLALTASLLPSQRCCAEQRKRYMQKGKASKLGNHCISMVSFNCSIVHSLGIFEWLRFSVSYGERGLGKIKKHS